MKKLLPFLLLFLTACAPNPLAISPGDWVQHKIDKQKYFIVSVSHVDNPRGHKGTDVVGRVFVKNEFGQEVDRQFAINEFERLEEKQSNTASDNESLQKQVERLQEEVRHIRRIVNTLDENIFSERKWNPTTQTYE